MSNKLKSENRTDSGTLIRNDSGLLKDSPVSEVLGVISAIWSAPLILAGRLFGENAEKAIEPIAKFFGTVAGSALAPLVKRIDASLEHPLEFNLKATRIIENVNGIYGEDHYITENKIVRRIYTCPFKDQPGAKILCHLGEIAGKELFSGMVPGSEYQIHQTMARGSDYCEYSYQSHIMNYESV